MSARRFRCLLPLRLLHRRRCRRRRRRRRRRSLCLSVSISRSVCVFLSHDF
jgi:hypothetical protein